MPAQPFYLLSFSALFSGRVVLSNILAMLPMTSSQVHLWSIGLWMLIGVLIISPTAGGWFRWFISVQKTQVLIDF